MKILAAEHSNSMHQVLRGASQVLGHGILKAHDAREVMEILPAHYPDIALIVLDWALPGVDGSEMLPWIKGDARFAQIPVMVLLSDEDSAAAIEAYQLGASECLVRSSTEQDLVTRMLECIGRAA
ncbi:MAG: response regulator [Candidatus Eisenbacteria sp.]|nr:response regulator [Candidatus Eisenbacteria bacterium]